MPGLPSQQNYQQAAAFMAASQMNSQQANMAQQQANMAQYLQHYQRLQQEARATAAEHRQPEISSHNLQQQRLQRQAMIRQAQINELRTTSQQQLPQQQPPQQQQQQQQSQPKPRPANIIPHKSAASQYTNKPSLHAYQQYGQQQPAHHNTDSTSQQQHQQQQAAAAAALSRAGSGMSAAPAHAQSEMARPMSTSAQQPQSHQSAVTGVAPSQSQQHTARSIDYTQSQQQSAPAAHMGLQQQRVPTSQPQQAHDHHQRYGHVPESSNRAPTNRYMPLKSMPSSQHQSTPQQQQQQSLQQPSLSHHSPQQPPPQQQQSQQQQQPSPRDQHHQQMSTASSHPATQTNTNISSHSIDHRKTQADQLAMQQQQAAASRPKPVSRAPPVYVPMKMDSMRRTKMAEEMEKSSSAQTSVTEATPSGVTSQSGHNAPPPSSQPMRMPKPATRVPYKMDSMRAQRQEKPEGESLSSFFGTSSAQSTSQSSTASQQQSSITSKGRSIFSEAAHVSQGI